MSPEEARAIAHPSRRAIVEALGASAHGLTVAEIAGLIGRHSNAVRQHLEVLQRAGVVVAAPSPPTGRRGRPSTRYALAAPGGVAAAGHRELVRLLLDLVRRTGMSHDEVEAFGWEQGRRIVTEDAPPEAISAAFASLGFAPEEVTSERARREGTLDVRLRACPFKEAVLAEGGELVCTLHRGLVRGALDRVDPSAELEAFEVKDPITAGCRVLATGLHRDPGTAGSGPPHG
ncbi:MAG TPA: helix-turn-helix domain-containing protein [Miltoncostaeaceae bacterium]|nr:helix-turn-helix domain-containing protein [Miltoncostaeaceae bacterium]